MSETSAETMESLKASRDIWYDRAKSAEARVRKLEGLAQEFKNAVTIWEITNAKAIVPDHLHGRLQAALAAKEKP